MRLGISSSWTHTSPEDWANQMVEMGCRSVVFPVDYHTKVNLIDEYVKAANERDFVIAEVGAWCNPLDKDAGSRAAAMERCVEQLKLADYVGARCCVNISGSASDKWDGAAFENFSDEFYDGVVNSIREILDKANPKNTFYTIEPMPWTVPVSPDEYLSLIKDVNHEQFAVHMDIVNWLCSWDRYFKQREFMDDVFAKLGAYIKSCHLKDAILLDGFTFQIKEMPCGQGKFDMDYYVDKINALDSQMPVLIEHLHSENEFRESMKYVNKRFAGK